MTRPDKSALNAALIRHLIDFRKEWDFHDWCLGGPDLTVPQPGSRGELPPNDCETR